MNAWETAFVILVTPVSAFAIAAWVLYDNRRMGQAARRRTQGLRQER